MEKKKKLNFSLLVKKIILVSLTIKGKTERKKTKKVRSTVPTADLVSPYVDFSPSETLLNKINITHLCNVFVLRNYNL
ncbi:hypothetical protein RIR_jg20686.t1 [Rhizophagus irregularis DAOM 181602=DAOM 197198]|nr:hypothetical protein RIR_jg20686.t1 [Rhizophagus irregularis DAOM 181602=DAOM 197198]